MSNQSSHSSIIEWSLMASLLMITLLAIINQDNHGVDAARRRCFACRSRGPLGDCKDQFEFNATTASSYGSSPVEVQPCASGWCGKTIEDEEEGTHIMATERMCLQRPPSDGKERCSKTFYSNRKKTFYMCFCKGDLCNGGGSIFTSTSAPTIFSITGLVIFFTLYILSA